MMRRILLQLTALLAVVWLAGCGTGAADRNDASPSASDTATASSTSASSTASPAASPTASAAPSGNEAALSAAKDIVEALRDRDLKRLSSWIDPEQGLRFSPYAAMTESDQIFKPDSLPSFKSTDKVNWGTADGSGEPIELTFRDYYDKFVYDKDFDSAPSVTAGKLVGQGNTVYNGQDIYPGSSFVEFHFPGSDDASGMDWESLIVTLVPSGGEWRLVALTHAQWTI